MVAPLQPPPRVQGLGILTPTRDKVMVPILTQFGSEFDKKQFLFNLEMRSKWTQFCMFTSCAQSMLISRLIFRLKFEPTQLSYN